MLIVKQISSNGVPLMIIYAKDYGVLPQTDCTKALAEMLESISEIEGEKTLLFEKGEYYITRQDCKYVYRAITNTGAPEEYDNPQEVNMHYCPFVIENAEALTLDGNGSVFVIDGKVTNGIFSNCKNLTVKNLQIKTLNPNLHKFTVIKQTPFYVDFKLDCNSKYEKNCNNFDFVGNGYRLGFFQYRAHSYWNAHIKPNCKNNVARTSHPFKGAIKIKELEPYVFRVYYPPFHRNFQMGEVFYVFNTHRSDVGIFAENCLNLTLDNVEQNFNYSLALVLQACENFNMKNCTFAPEKGSEYEICSLADFIQACMCNGEINIKNNYFDGACDDCLNAHGIHFKVEKSNDNKITVAFCHPQSWGFNPLEKGDKIEFIDPQSLLSVAENRILESTLVDSHHIELTLENAPPANCKAYVIEDTSKCPALNFENNILNRIITRGILYTSRGKCQIKNNHFMNNTMSGILLSDDAKSWYESGMCLDVNIEGNTFDYCGETPVLVKPENSIHRGAVHKNIKIINNVFKDYKGEPISIKSTESIEIKGNRFLKNESPKLIDCNNIHT